MNPLFAGCTGAFRGSLVYVSLFKDIYIVKNCKLMCDTGGEVEEQSSDGLPSSGQSGPDCEHSSQRQQTGSSQKHPRQTVATCK